MDTPKVERGRDGKYRKPDGFRMIDIAIDESDDHLDEVEKSSERDRQMRNSIGRNVGSAVLGVGSGVTALGAVGQARRTATSLKVGRHHYYKPGKLLRFGVKNGGRQTAALGAATVGMAAGSHFLRQGLPKKKPVAKSAFSKDDPNVASSHINQAMKTGKVAVAQAPKMVKPVAQMSSTVARGKMQQVKTTIGKDANGSRFGQGLGLAAIGTGAYVGAVGARTMIQGQKRVSAMKRTLGPAAAGNKLLSTGKMLRASGAKALGAGAGLAVAGSAFARANKPKPFGKAAMTPGQKDLRMKGRQQQKRGTLAAVAGGYTAAGGALFGHSPLKATKAVGGAAAGGAAFGRKVIGHGVGRSMLTGARAVGQVVPKNKTGLLTAGALAGGSSLFAGGVHHANVGQRNIQASRRP